MAVTAHIWANVDQASLTKQFSLGAAGDSLYVLLIAGSSPAFLWNATSQAYTTVSQFLAGDGTSGALTEVITSGTSYTRQALVTPTITSSGLVTTLNLGANPTWPASTISAKFALFFDAGSGGSGTSAGDSAANKLLCYWDFGGTNSSSSGSFTLTIAGAGLATWTAS